MARTTPLALTLTLALIAACGPAAPFPAPAASAQLSLTVYSSADPAGFDPQQFIAQQRQGYNPNSAWQVPGFGVVKDVRDIQLGAGRNDVSFTDVAAFIDPTTVSFTDLTNPDGTVVLEQQFLFDLVSPEKLLDRYVDQTITIRVPMGDGGVEEVTGTLLSNNQGQLVLRTPSGLRLIPRGSAQVQLGDLPGGLITRPTLRWLLTAQLGGPHKVRTTYQTSGLTWKADYNLILNQADTRADLGSWVTLINLSGISYPDANLKLIAGDVQRIQQPQQMYRGGRVAEMAMAADAAGFQEKSFYEYHLYTLPRATTVAENTTQQIALFPAVSEVPVKKVLVYDAVEGARNWGYGTPRIDQGFGNQSSKKVDVYLKFRNDEQSKLGIPLPKGKVRVYKRDDADGSLEFIGEDLIDHTSRNETVLIRTGQSFDVTGQRTQTNFNVDARARVITESFHIELNNAKNQPADVIVRETLYRWSNWQITRNSDDYEKIDSRTIHFNVQVPAEGTKAIDYTVRYTW